MKHKGTRFFNPETITELKEIALKESDIKLLAGGTALFRTINSDRLDIPGAIILLDNIPELKKENRTERYFEFGSMLTIQELINSSKKLPQILRTQLLSSSPFPVRNTATIGGTLANREFISDIIPLLLLFNCKVEVISFNDKKIKPKWESITQYTSALQQRELHLITRVRIPLIYPTFYEHYKTGFKYNLFSEISFSAIAEIEKSSVSSLSMAFNIENKKIIRAKEIEAELIGKHVPINHRMREPLIQSISTSLGNYGDLDENQIYRMTQIILQFLEGI